MADTKITKVAPSIVEALNKIDPKYIFKAKAVITVSYARKKAEALLYPLQTRRLFANNLAKELFQKRMIGAMH